MEALATTAQAVNNFKNGLKGELTAEQKRGIAEIKKLVAVFKTEKSNDDEEIQKLEVMMKEKRAEFEERRKNAIAASDARKAESDRLKQLWEDRISDDKKEQETAYTGASMGYDKEKARQFRAVFRKRLRRSKFLVPPKESDSSEINEAEI
ncbi:Oidioi.mRNA.OKI2018_I69.chr2.g7053.t1.cds [Oikopleura dioica]|uniref:Oidioi.mRNA.OKI2018_I69.chr2.g7053.t1.cds n=1 Tax=Oikopleura dioica TaxID=34765 RepID=A0ABN7TE38_OIKDI|nr:Oidioi.mRNA.OKI2018_I69.chr2.g7053.t1.cds [Oikopleura dioica]